MAAPPRNKATRRRILIQEKEGRALELRKAGATFEVIGRELGYASRDGAFRAVQRAMQATIQEPADALRKVERERLDVMQRALWPAVLAGDTMAIKTALGVMERRAKLLGLDAPVRRLVEVITHDAFSEAMREIEAEIAALEASQGEVVATQSVPPR